MIDEYFRLLTVFESYQPLPFLQSPFFRSTLECAISCVGVNELYAIESVLEYLRDSISFSMSPEIGIPRCNVQKSTTETQMVVKPLVNQLGNALVVEILKSTISTMPIDIMSLAALIIAQVIHLVDGTAVNWIETYVKSLPDDVAPVDVKLKFVTSLSNHQPDQADWLLVRRKIYDFVALVRRRSVRESA